VGGFHSVFEMTKTIRPNRRSAIPGVKAGPATRGIDGDSLDTAPRNRIEVGKVGLVKRRGAVHEHVAAPVALNDGSSSGLRRTLR
jgi:hypothetical protein